MGFRATLVWREGLILISFCLFASFDCVALIAKQERERDLLKMDDNDGKDNTTPVDSSGNNPERISLKSEVSILSVDLWKI